MTMATRSSIWIDYAKGRFDSRATVPVTATELVGIASGDTVDVVGDEVETRHAVVRNIDASVPRSYVAAMVTLEFLD